MLLLVIKATILGVFLLPPFLRNKKTTYIILGSFMTVKFGNFRTFWKGLSNISSSFRNYLQIFSSRYSIYLINMNTNYKETYFNKCDNVISLFLENHYINDDDIIYFVFSVTDISKQLYLGILEQLYQQRSSTAQQPQCQNTKFAPLGGSCRNTVTRRIPADIKPGIG